MILALKQALDQALSEGALIITATRRLAKQWQPILVRNKVDTSPRIIAQNDWLNQVWSALEACGLTGEVQLLSALQEKVLWKNVIESSNQAEQLLRLGATANSVASAAQLLKQWDLSLETVRVESNFLSEELDLFLQWAELFNSILNQNKFITQNCLPNIILNLMAHIQTERQTGHILESYAITKKIKLLGFEDIPPQLQRFYTELRLKGWDITQVQVSEYSDTILNHDKYGFYNQEQEIRAAALWAQALKKEVNYAGAIGVVIPDLAGCRSRVVQIFTEILEPLSELKPEQQVSDQFNISVALPLSSYPIIFAGLKSLLLLKMEKIELNDLILLIRSPFIKLFGLDTGVDTLIKAQAIYLLKKLKKSLLNFSDWKFLQDGFLKLTRFKESIPPKASMSEWAFIFEKFLKLIEWPGARVLNSIEHQAVARWQLLLEEFASLESIIEAQDINSAIKLLSALANDTLFQGQSKPAPIHIMGILEASSQPFDYLWVTGLHNEAWPPIPQANPFLPITLQRKYQMPHASSEREYAFSKKLMDNLKNACETVVFSYFKNDTVKSYYPSDLISEYPEKNISLKLYYSDNKISPDFNIKINILESIVDDEGDVINNNEYCEGGALLLQTQAICPFKAFARYRLQAVEKDKVYFGLEAKERGILVHKILEYFWKKIKNQKVLLDSDKISIEKLLDQKISEQIEHLKLLYNELPISFWEAEHWRLKSIIQKWLILEKNRSDFTVLEQELSADIILSGLKFKIKIDRLDKDNNNQLIIIDYKTSDQNLSDCLENRLQAPQLPLYCMSTNFKAKAAVFGQLQAQGCKWVGVAEAPLLPDIKIYDNWDELLIQWKESLESLALEFKQGYAKVQPYKQKQSCRTCHLLQVCRVQSVDNE